MKQLTEDYVSFETAKLLKEKGFNEPTKLMIDLDGIIRDIGYIQFNINLYWTDKTCCCVTHQMALKWLRKVHNIVLNIAFEANKGWTFYVSRLIVKTISDGSTYIVGIQHSVWSDDVQQPYCKEYEEAVEAALLYVLKNLI